MSSVKNFDPAATVGAAALHQKKEKSMRGDSDVLKAKAMNQTSSLPIQQKKKKSIHSGAKEARISSSLPIQQKKEKSMRGGCSPKDSGVLKAKAMNQISSLPIQQKKKKSIQGCSTKDSAELKAKEAQISSLPIQQNREEIPIWGCSLPKDSDELKAKAAEFSTLPIQENFDFAAMEKKGSKSEAPKESMGKKGVKSEAPKEPMGKKGFESAPEEPMGKKGSKSSPKEPMGKKGSKSSPKEPMKKKGEAPEKKGSESEAPKFNLRCLGDEIVAVDRRCLYESGKLYNALQVIDEMRKKENMDSRFPYFDARDIGSYPIEIQSPKHIVEMVNELCIQLFNILTTHADVHLLSHKLEAFNCRFLRNKPLSVLLQLLHAASQLKIKSLMNLVCFDIVDMHAGKFADEILFNMPIFNMPIFYRDPHYLTLRSTNLGYGCNLNA